ncbi:GHMP kinase [Candidatus Poribacteria bacterium]|nr:GHMP kinase [Candidatus Poribacteria bacterium]
MRVQLNEILKNTLKRSLIPTVIAYNRIDGPGSSLDLREFQQALWAMPEIPKDLKKDISMAWTRNLPRTIGITIDSGTKIEALPFKPDMIGVKSIDYGTEVTAKPGEVVPTRDNWLLKIIDLFGLSGVMFVLQNLRAGIHSSGLGGSATATTGVCILANELAGKPLSPIQLVSMASRMEQDYGVSITGTQEQSNVIFGGVIDYVWFPWGFPGKPESGYGESLRTILIQQKDYNELEKRMTIFHTGISHLSTDVNSVWRHALTTSEGFKLHSKKTEIAYQFREGLRLFQWDMVLDSIKKYRQIRQTLCNAYMEGAKEILKLTEARGGIAFPLGAGGGGGVLVFCPQPEKLNLLREELKKMYREIPLKIKTKGHELINLPIK